MPARVVGIFVVRELLRRLSADPKVRIADQSRVFPAIRSDVLHELLAGSHHAFGPVQRVLG